MGKLRGAMWKDIDQVLSDNAFQDAGMTCSFLWGSWVVAL
jgi:hypothetical protein